MICPLLQERFSMKDSKKQCDIPLPEQAQQEIMDARLGPVKTEEIKLPIPPQFPVFEVPTPSQIMSARLDYTMPPQTKK